MNARVKAFVIWLVIPYLSLYVLAPIVVSLRRHEPIPAVFTLGYLAAGLVYCAIPAAIGTGIVWIVRLKRPIWGFLSGFVIGICLVALIGWIQLLTFGRGFEAGANVLAAVSLLLIPSGIAGGLAGVLRERELQN